MATPDWFNHATMFNSNPRNFLLHCWVSRSSLLCFLMGGNLYSNQISAKLFFPEETVEANCQTTHPPYECNLNSAVWVGNVMMTC